MCVSAGEVRPVAAFAADRKHQQRVQAVNGVRLAGTDPRRPSFSI